MIEDSPSSTSGQPNPLDFSIPNVFSNYGEMPSKGYCRLFKAQRYGKWFVLKGLQPQHNADPVYMAMLQKEFDAAIKMDHPNIVKTFEIEDDPVVGKCIVMEYVDGRTLSKFLEEHPSAKLRKKITFQLLDAMRYYHSLQIVHRDLKPSNILITRNGDNVKIIDFGLADADDYVVLKEPAYTKGYAAPEQMRQGAAIDCRTDLYAFGILLRKLFPHRYGAVARRCTKENPDSRYQDAAHVANAIEHINKLSLVTFFFIAIFVSFFFLNVLLPNKNVEITSDRFDTTIVIAQKDTAITDVLIEEEKNANQASKEIENEPTVEIATQLLYSYSDSLLNDFKLRLSRDEFPTWNVAYYNRYINFYKIHCYLYYLLAHFETEKKDESIKSKIFHTIFSPTINVIELYDSIDYSFLPKENDEEYVSHLEWGVMEKKLKKKFDFLYSEVIKLNNFYHIGDYDSIIYHTQQYYPPINVSNH